MSARRDLGPDYEDAVVDSFLDKMGKEVDRRVDERLATLPKGAGGRQGPTYGQRLALAIVSLSLGTFATLAVVLFADEKAAYIPVWIAIVIVNAVFNNK